MELLDLLTVVKDFERLHEVCGVEDHNHSAKLHSLCQQITKGKYLDIIKTFDGSAVANHSLLNFSGHGNAYITIHDAVISYIEQDGSGAEAECAARTFEMLILGVAYLELYCQINYTGPELPPAHLTAFHNAEHVESCIRHLECDGSYPFRSIEIPQTLLFARIILSTITDPASASWREGIALDGAGVISRKRLETTGTTSPSTLKSVRWWSARAAVVHLRLLQKQSYEDTPTLWQEVGEHFQYVLSDFASVPTDTVLTAIASPHAVAPEQMQAWGAGCSLAVPAHAPHSVQTAWPQLQRQFAAQAWLEWGLCCLHFGFGDKGKRCFALAKQVAGLEVSMTAAMGKRTKHQHSEYAQLFLFAKSGLMGGGDAPPLPEPAPKKAESVGQILPPRPPTEEEEQGEKNPDAWQHSEWEMGRRMVRENASGEEVAVREVLLDSMDGGAVENIVLEGGPKFSSAELDKGGVLHPIDQAIVLALCLDVSNSNPVDGLTNEEMQPYVERVLGLATNWMIHSTALLERSWLEFERRKTMDRAMLQIQALIDQHTTKLTVMQSTYKSIEESAPVEDRMRYLYSIVYPAQYELKRDLATRYLRCQVFMSALNYFRELEMWDEVVTCYQLMEKPHRAELVVREQLAKAGETPYMLTSLADLTRKEEYYDRAWEISKGRFPRAKRTLGKICYDRGDFEACITHLDFALSVHPLVATAWYLKGLACMRLERWDEAIESFVRCVQQDMEIGEAWANIGAINMRLRQWPKAFEALTEALRHKQDSWRIVENLMTVALAMGRWKDTTRFMQRLLDLRMKSQRPIHKDELRHLCYITASQGQREARARAKAAAAHVASAAWSTSDATAPTDADDLTDFEPAASPPHPPTSEAVLAALASLREVLEEDSEFDADDINTVLEVAPQPGDTILAVDKLLTNITVAVPSDAEVWDVYADFQHTLGRFRLELDCRTKQFRKLTSEEAWEKDAAKIHGIAACAKLLARAHHFKGVTKTDFYTGKMILQTAQRRIAAGPLEAPEDKAVLDNLIAKFSSICDSL